MNFLRHILLAAILSGGAFAQSAMQSAAESPELLAERPLNSALLLLASMVSAVLLWACVTAVVRTGYFRRYFGIRTRSRRSCKTIWLWPGLDPKKNMVSV